MVEKYNKAVVLGLGGSGAGAARLLLREGTAVTMVDEGDKPELQERADILRSAGAQVYLGVRELPPGDYDVAVISPGIPLSSTLARAAVERKISLISEIELGWSRYSGQVLALTGSNGKSTMVKFCTEALQGAGKRALAAGNYGPSLCDVVLNEGQKADVLVVEVSSFQLETVQKFRPQVAVLLNLYPNHLDRHGTLDAYLAAKARLFSQQTASDLAIVPLELRATISTNTKARLVTFGRAPTADYCYTDNQVVSVDGQRVVLGKGVLANDVWGQNTAAAVAALQYWGVAQGIIEKAAKDLDPLPHRMERCGRKNGVIFINDSKATNLASLMASVRMAGRPVRLIAGGRAKESDFSAAQEVLAKHTSAVYLIGEAADKMTQFWSAKVPCHLCGDLATAVQNAWGSARPGEVILLAPGCTSFDQFRNYEERGDLFKKLVNELVEDKNEK